jgi:hypothetical protein
MKSEKELVTKLIKKYQPLFRILKDWKIKYEDDGKYYDQCGTSYGKIRKASIYPVSMETDMDDYVYHEILHICQAELRKGKYPEKREKEEMFVQDLCVIYKNNNKT